MHFICLCLPFVHSSLQSIAHGFRIYKGGHLHDIGFVDASLQAVFTKAASLNSWRLRAVIHILLMLQSNVYSMLSVFAAEYATIKYINTLYLLLQTWLCLFLTSS